MTTLPIKLVADQGASGTSAWPTADAAAVAELQATVAHLADVVAALSTTLSVTVTNQPAPPLTNAQLRQSPVPVAGVFGDENGVPFSELNPLPVDVGGNISVENLSVQYDSFISTANSTDTPLAADEVFIGVWEDVKNFAAINASILTNAGSAFHGAVAEFSADGINVMTRQAATVPGGTGAYFSFAPQGRYFRINYTNGPFAQTTLEVEVKYSFNAPAITQAPLGALTTDASITTGTTAAMQGRIMAGPSTGVWQPIGTDGAGNLMVAAAGQQTDALTDAQLRASVVGVTNQSGRALALPPVKATVTAVGNTTVHTPAAGKRVRLLWTYAINDPTATTAPLIRVSLGAEEQLRVWAVSKGQVLEGPVDGPIVVNLDVAARVAFTAFIEEF